MSAEKNNHPIIKPTFRWVFSSPSRILAFGFGSGLAPTAPGTVGTLLAWASFLIAQYYLTTEIILWVLQLELF